MQFLKNTFFKGARKLPSAFLNMHFISTPCIAPIPHQDNCAPLLKSYLDHENRVYT